ncbi:MAG: lipoprotein [Proteobacteria bacterium]|nr:lipoprotein [Pseudomonadota bacterium]
MSCVRVALVAAAALMLCGCGQKGSLYLPTEPAAAGRATLPQALIPTFPASAASAPSAPDK